MKKTLLSVVAVVAMAFAVVACGNGKIVDAQVKSLETFSAKLDSVETMDQYQAAVAEYATATEANAKASEGKKFSEAETAKITAAATQVTEKLQAVGQKLAEKAAADEAKRLADEETARIEAEKTAGKPVKK